MRNFFNPPIFDNEGKTFEARLIYAVSAGMIALSIGFNLLIPFLAPELQGRAVLLGLVVMSFCIIILMLTHTGRTHISRTALVIALWLVITSTAFINGGLDAPIYAGYFIVIIVGGLLFRQTGAYMIALLCLASGATMLYADRRGLLPAPHIEYSDIARWAIYGFFFAAAMIIQHIAMTTSREASTRARKSEKKYLSLLEKLPTIIYINGIAKDTPTEYVGPQVIKLLGYSHKDFLDDKQLWIKILHPADRDRVVAENQRTNETGEPFNIDYRLIARDGQAVWVHDEALLVYDEDGRPDFWLGVWSDISLRKNMEDEQANLMAGLTRRTIQMQTAAEVSRATSSILDINLLLPQVVERIREHFEYYYVGIFLTDDANRWAVLRAATGEMGKTMLAEGHQLELNGKSMIGWCIVNKQARIALDVGEDAVRLKNPILPLTRSEMALPLIARGHVIGAMTIQSEKPAAFSQGDILSLQTMADQVAISIENARLFTERITLINELETKNAELERFTYTVSHDLKSPLVTIKGFLGYLHQDAKTGDLTRFDKDMARVANAVDTMQVLLNDLLELSRIGRLTNPPEDIPFFDLVREAIELTHGRLRERGTQIDVQPDLPVIHGDHARLVEALQNLIDNAIKFMGDQPEPRVQIGMARYDQDNKPLFFIRDNGTGIEPKYHERVFGLFNRLDPTIEGTGIGLTLVKRIIEVHGGRIWVESEGIKKGATFFFSLPASQTRKGGLK